jgi:putative ABC transport system permease protein
VIGELVTHLLRDARFGFRLLRKKPGFTAVAVLTLAVGIAANTAIFSVVYATYLAPLPYRDPDRLVTVWTRLDGNRLHTDAGDFAEWKRQATVFEDLNAWSTRSVNLATGDRPEHVEAAVVTPGLLRMMGERKPLALGRDFLEEEGEVGRDQVALLSHRLWQTRFGGDRAIIGRQIRIDGKPHTVVGVLGAGAADRVPLPLWLPLAFTPEEVKPEVPDLRLTIIGRLKRGVTVEQAHASMVALVRGIAQTAPRPYAWSASVEPYRNSFLSDRTKTALWLLLGAVTFVLLIACANVANLLLARGATRQRELAVRASLGASQAAIVRQLMTENLILALMGGGLGVALAAGLLRAIMALLPPATLPSEAEVGLNVPVLLFALAACGLCGILFGCAPAWRVARASVSETLKDAARSLGSGRDRMRRALVVAEFALALTLLAGGGLAIHSIFKLASIDPGFRTERLLTFSLPVPPGRLKGTDEINTFYRELIDRVRVLPGVQFASVSTSMPVQEFGFAVMKFGVVGQPASAASKLSEADLNVVSPGYLDTFGIPLKRGRGLTEQDREGSLPVAIVNEAFVRRYLPNLDPLAQRLAIRQLMPDLSLGPAIQWQIVGVDGDVRNADPKTTRAEIIVPFWQSPWPVATMGVRTVAGPMRVRQEIAAVIGSLDPDLPMADVKTMEQIVGESMAGDRFNTVLFGSFAAVALLLAAVGIYGVMSFVVAQRTHEIGLRMALGADRGRVLGQVLREGMTTALAGTALGSAGAYSVGRAMRGMLYGVGVVDPEMFIAVALTLLAAALVACLVPARRAAAVDPMVALRQE